MRTLNLRPNIRTAAAILMSTAILVALAASGETSTTSSKEPAKNETPAKNESSQSNGEQNKPSGSGYTVSQENAIKSAEEYLSTTAFSRAGLIEQLSSSAGSGYSTQDAEFAVEHLHVNWNEQAVKSAKQYLSTSSFSCQGLIEQLDSSAGSKYTQAQAEYAARQVGLC